LGKTFGQKEGCPLLRLLEICGEVKKPFRGKKARMLITSQGLRAIKGIYGVEKVKGLGGMFVGTSI